MSVTTDKERRVEFLAEAHQGFLRWLAPDIDWPIEDSRKMVRALLSRQGARPALSEPSADAPFRAGR